MVSRQATTIVEVVELAIGYLIVPSMAWMAALEAWLQPIPCWLASEVQAITLVATWPCMEATWWESEDKAPAHQPWEKLLDGISAELPEPPELPYPAKFTLSFSQVGSIGNPIRHGKTLSHPRKKVCCSCPSALFLGQELLSLPGFTSFLPSIKLAFFMKSLLRTRLHLVHNERHNPIFVMKKRAKRAMHFPHQINEEPFR